MKFLGSFIIHMSHKLLFLAMVLVVTGCSNTSSYQSVPLLSNEMVADTAKGVVVARVVVANSQRYPFNELNLIPKNYNSSKTIKAQSLEAKPAKSGQSVIFAGEVNPGSYSLGSITSYHSFGEYYYIDGVKADLGFGTFSVEANKVTDLGVVIYYPKSQEGSFRKTLIRLPVEEPAKLMSQFFPFYEYDKSLVLSWDEDGFADERESAYLSAVQNPTNFTRNYLADDGYLYVLAPLGVILIRTPDGQWLTDAVDSSLPLRSIAKNAAGDLILGGDEGKVFVKHSGSDFYKDVSIGLDFDIQEVAFDDAGNMLLIASRGTYMGLFKSQVNISGLHPKWQAVKRYNSFSGWHDNDGYTLNWKGFKEQQRIMNARLEKSEKELLLTVSYQKRGAHLARGNTKQSRYKVNLNELSFHYLAKKPKVDVVIDAGAMQIGINKPSFFSWTGMPDFMVKNRQSNEWEDVSTRIKQASGAKLKFNFLSTPWFSSPENGVAIAKVGEDESLKLIVSTNGGKNWSLSKHKLPNDYCVAIIPQIRDRILLGCDGATGDFYESTDNGKTWEHVREHEEF